MPDVPATAIEDECATSFPLSRVARWLLGGMAAAFLAVVSFAFGAGRVTESTARDIMDNAGGIQANSIRLDAVEPQVAGLQRKSSADAQWKIGVMRTLERIEAKVERLAR